MLSAILNRRGGRCFCGRDLLLLTMDFLMRHGEKLMDEATDWLWQMFEKDMALVERLETFFEQWLR